MCPVVTPPIIQCFYCFYQNIKNHEPSGNKVDFILVLLTVQAKTFFHNYLFSQFTEYATTVYICLCPIQCSSHHHPHHHSVCFCIILFSNRVTIKMLQGWGYVSSSFSPALYRCITWSNKLPGCMNTYSSWVVGEICSNLAFSSNLYNLCTIVFSPK